MRRSYLLAALGVILAASAAAQPSASRADRQALAEIVAEHGVATAPETPGLSAYARDLGDAVVDWLTLRLDRVAPGMAAFVAGLARVGAGVVFAVALVLLALLLYRVARRHLAGREPRETAPARAAAAAGEEPPGADWAAEIRRRLAAGDVAAACEALWWWLARALVRDGVESSWTSRELLARAGRSDLAPPVRRLDRMIYGPAAPAVDDVRRLWSELEEAVG